VQISLYFVAKPYHINLHNNSGDEAWQMWHSVLCQEHDVNKDGVGCTGTPFREHNLDHS
jgi:hypothetical protein